MYKKACIVVGVLLIVAAVAIYFIVSAVQNKSEEPTPDVSTVTSTQVSSVTPTQPPIQTPQVVQPSTTQSAVAEQTPLETTTNVPETTSSAVQEPATVDGTTIIALDPEKLPAYTDTTDVGRVVGHNVYSYNGQVLFSLLINTTMNGQIEYFTTLRNYQLADGTQLNCELRIYSSTSGYYPSIISVATSDS